MMDRCRPGAGATDDNLLSCLVVVESTVAAALGGLSAGALGYTGHLVAAALVAALSVGVVTWLFPPRSVGSARPTEEVRWHTWRPA